MNIVIADSHSLCREALGNFIQHAEQDIEINGVADYAGLVEFLNANKADILLLDADLPGLSFMGNVADIKNSYPDLRVGLMMLSMDALAVSSDQHAQGFFPKYLSSKAFLQGMHIMMAGERFFPDDKFVMQYQNDEALLSVHKNIDDFHLTTREKQVLSFLVQGATNKDIARALDLQVVTVKLHVRGICRKISAKNRTQAALIAQENGWNG